MKHTNFDESNSIKRAGDIPNCDDLHTYEDQTEDGRHFIISSWDITQTEIINLLLFRRLWLHVWYPVQPPVYLSTISPFVHSPNKAEPEETAKIQAFKKRLADLFMLNKNYEQTEAMKERIKDAPDLRDVLIEFIDYLMERGEDDN